MDVLCIKMIMYIKSITDGASAAADVDELSFYIKIINEFCIKNNDLCINE